MLDGVDTPHRVRQVTSAEPANQTEAAGDGIMKPCLFYPTSQSSSRPTAYRRCAAGPRHFFLLSFLPLNF